MKWYETISLSVFLLILPACSTAPARTETRTELLRPSDNLLQQCRPADGEDKDGKPYLPLETTGQLVESRENWIGAWQRCAVRVDQIINWYKRQDQR